MFLQTDRNHYGRKRRRSSRRHSLLLLIMGLAFSVLGGLLIFFPRDPHDKLDRIGLAYLGIAAMLMVVRFLVGIRHEWRARRSRAIREKLRAADAQRTGDERALA